MVDRRSDFVEFATARRPQLHRLAVALTGDWHHAEDLVQMTLARAYVAWPKIKRRAAEDAYVRTTLVRLSINESRRPWKRERPSSDDLEAQARPVDVAASQDLLTALGALPEMQRRVVVLRHWWGLSVAETATDLGIAEGTVKSHCARALQRLGQLMSAEGAVR